MKTLKKIFLLSVAMVLSMCIIAQAPPVDTTGVDAWKPFADGVTLDGLNEIYNVLFGAIVIVWGYVAKAFGFKSKSKVPFVFVILAGALVAAGAFVFAGFEAVPIVITFFISLGIFDLILKPAEKLLRGKQPPKVAVS